MEDFDRKRLFWTRLTALATLSLLVIVLVTIIVSSIKVADMQDDFDRLVKMADAMEGMSDNLANVSKQLEQIDWEGLAVNINLTAEKAQQSMDAALVAIDELDIDTLNEAIANLRDVIDPLAKFFNTFN